MTPALRLDGLTVRAPGGEALVDGASLSLPAGGCLCVIGQTGSGKSLVAQAVMGLLPTGLRAEGTVAVGPETFAAGDAKGLRGLWNRRTGLVPQEPAMALDPMARVGRQIGPASAGAVAAALAALDLAPVTLARYPFMLSGGMAQRVLVANARLSPAGLIVADEPTKGLDPDRVAGVLDLLRGLRAAGKALLVVTHDLAVARALGENGSLIAVMRDAVIVETGPTEAVLAHPAHPYTRAWLAADPAHWAPCATCLLDGDVVLAAHGLSFSHERGAPLFAGLHLHLRRGEVLAVTGPSGTGKTTLGNVLLGLMPPRNGEVLWQGVDPYAEPAAARRLRRRYQKLHQDPAAAFVPHRALGRQLYDVATTEARAALPALLDRLRLRPTLLARRIAEISGGEAQRLALARLLLMEPAVIVADEPTSRLDPIVQRETILLLRDLVAERGLSVILVSHHAALVEAVADTVLALDRMTTPEPVIRRRAA
jgi:peptide/nickel transport system ATP-binding protein